jgi:hypothetical protein
MNSAELSESRALENVRSNARVPPKCLETIAFYVPVSAIEEPARFVRELAREWKSKGGTVAGKPRHSDRYLIELLHKRRTPIKSLTPKLAGKTNVRPAEAQLLVQLFLSHWKYIGDPKSNEVSERPSESYEAMLPVDEIEEVAQYVMNQISESAQGGKGEVDSGPVVSTPGNGIAETIAAEFQKSVAMFVVGPGQVLLVQQPEMALIGFRNLINRLWEIDTSDDQERILVWTLDLGRQDFEDLDSRLRFMNAEALISRFKALKQFKESNTEARWKWLRSRALILLHDTQGARPDVPRLPNFGPDHILFSAIPPKWLRSPKFPTLYGTSFERLSDSSYTIFLERSNQESLDQTERAVQISSNLGRRHDIHYFGHAVLESADTGEREAMSVELDTPGRSYAEALGTVFVAAMQTLGLRTAQAELLIDGMKIDQTDATEKLRHCGFLLRKIDDFLKF